MLPSVSSPPPPPLTSLPQLTPTYQVCAVCTRSPAAVDCQDCNNQYCQSCFKVFHAMGRKKKHKHGKLMEQRLPESDEEEEQEEKPAWYVIYTSLLK